MKVPKVMELALNNDIDVVCLQETWLRKCDKAVIEEIKSYNYEVITERKPRKCDIGGGVAILYKKNLPIKRIMYNFGKKCVASAPLSFNLLFWGGVGSERPPLAHISVRL